VAEKDHVSRRRFLGGAALALGGLTGLGAALRAIGGTLPSSAAGAGRPIDLGPIDGFPEGRFVVATFLSDPEAGEVSRRAAYVRNNGLVGNRPSFTIMSSRCTHVGCPTQPNGPLLSRQQKLERGATGEVGLVPTLNAGGFGCPCHGSQFDQEGARIAGPAVRPLDRFQWEIRRDGHLWLTQRWSVLIADGKVSYFPVKSPGQPLDGQLPWATADILYPAVTYQHGPAPD
jgi:Rieske Fe-S protein